MHAFRSLSDALASRDFRVTAQFVIVIIFAWSGASKLVWPSTVLTTIRQVAGQSFPTWVGRGIGLFEVATAIAFLDVWGAPAAKILGIGLSVLFVAVITLALLRREGISCGCFSAHGSPITGWTLARTIAIAVLVADARTDRFTDLSRIAAENPAKLAVALIGVAATLGALRGVLAKSTRILSETNWHLALRQRSVIDRYVSKLPPRQAPTPTRVHLGPTNSKSVKGLT